MQATAEHELIAGNWESFRDFMWFEQPADAAERALVYVSNRDSDLLTESNAAQIEKALEPYTGDDESFDVIPQCHNHFLCGYVDGFAIRIERDGVKTRAAEIWEELQAQIADYPILDEEDFSERETEAQEQAYKDWGAYDLIRALEKLFDYEIDDTLGEFRELFDKLRDRANVYWEMESSGVSINIGRIADAATIEDLAPFIARQSIRIFVAGDLLTDAEFHCGRIENRAPLYDRELGLIENAIEFGAESLTIDNKNYTWNIN